MADVFVYVRHSDVVELVPAAAPESAAGIGRGYRIGDVVVYLPAEVAAQLRDLIGDVLGGRA